MNINSIRSQGLRYLLAPLAALLLTASGPAPDATRAEAPVRIVVDVSERMLYVHHGGEVMNSFEIAVGEPEHPTPRGSFEIDRIIWNPAWVPPDVEWAEDEERKEPGDPDNPMQAAKLFFEYPDYYIHGTNAPETLGDAESHGCIRMRPADVESLAQFVQEHGGESRSDGWYERLKSSDSNQTEVTLPSPVPIEIRD